MRCDIAVGSVEKNVIVLLLAGCLVVRRLLVENVDCSCSNLAFSQSVSEILLIYETASCSVNDPDTSLALIELLLGEHVVCFLCLRCMKCDEVALGKELIKSLASCNSELVELLLGDIRIVSNYVHAYTLKLSGYDRTDTAKTDNTCCLALELDSYPVAASEVTVVYALICCAKVTEDRESVTYCELTCCHVVSSRCVKRDNAVLCTSLNIDVVDTCSGSAYCLKAICIIQECLVDLSS